MSGVLPVIHRYDLGFKGRHQDRIYEVFAASWWFEAQRRLLRYELMTSHRPDVSHSFLSCECVFVFGRQCWWCSTWWIHVKLRTLLPRPGCL